MDGTAKCKKVEVLTLAVLFNRWREVGDSSRQMIQPLGRWLRIKWIKTNSAWRNLLLSIQSRDSGVTSSDVDAESWRTKIGCQNPAFDLCMFKLGACGTVRNEIDFFNVHLRMNLELNVFTRAGTGNETTYYLSLPIFYPYILHGGPQPPKCWNLTPLLKHTFLAGWQITMIWSLSSHFITMWV